MSPNGAQQVHNTSFSLSSLPACPEPPPLPFCGLLPRDRSLPANMAASAQDPDPQQHGPGRTRSGATFAIGPPATPKIHRVQPVVNTDDLSFRRAAPNVPFFAELGVDRDGPLESARGLLHDVAQIFEALNHGFKGQPPLGINDITAVVTAIILPIAAPGDANNIFDPIIQAVTDFEGVRR